MEGQPFQVPLKVQLEAICLPVQRQAQTLLSPTVPNLRSWDDENEPFAAYKERVRQHFTFTPDELIAYLREHPETAKTLVQDSYDKRTSPSTFIEEWSNGHYRVGWVDDQSSPVITQIRVFLDFAEAAADYVLFSWGMPRLTKAAADWYEMEHY